jgi:hypothetical protein
MVQTTWRKDRRLNPSSPLLLIIVGLKENVPGVQMVNLCSKK